MCVLNDAKKDTIPMCDLNKAIVFGSRWNGLSRVFGSAGTDLAVKLF